MTETFEALTVAVVAVLPGALYVWGFEQQVGRWGATAADRVLRFIGWSAMLHAAFAPVTLQLWVVYVRTGRVGRGDVPIWLWALVLGYVLLPALAGRVVGAATTAGAAWARVLTGRRAAPRAWDHLFASAPRGWVRMKLKSGSWIGGIFARTGDRPDGVSYAAGYPESQDLYLARLVEVDGATGEVVLHDGKPTVLNRGVLIRWEEVEYLEFTAA